MCDEQRAFRPWHGPVHYSAWKNVRILLGIVCALSFDGIPIVLEYRCAARLCGRNKIHSSNTHSTTEILGRRKRGRRWAILLPDVSLIVC